MFNLLLGAPVADELYQKIKNKVYDKMPHLAVIQIGDDPASGVYIKYKKQACEKLNFGFSHFKLEENTTNQDITEIINKINLDVNITGCIIQLPLPVHLDKFYLINLISPSKDVDCLTCFNMGKLFQDENCHDMSHAFLDDDDLNMISATSYGILLMLKHYNISTKGKLCIILGKSIIVGKPLANLLGAEEDPGCTVMLCDKDTKNSKELIKMADILVVATGIHHLINNPDDLKPGVVIVDVGIHNLGINPKTGLRRVEGDVDFDKVAHMCSWITPVPRGVGPMTVAVLMWNLSKTSIASLVLDSL